MDKCDPVGKERPEEEREIIAGSVCWDIDKKYIYFISSQRTVGNPQGKTESAPLPVIIHVLNLPLDKAVNALAVGPVCETTDHAEPIWPLLSGKKLLNGNHNPLSPLLMAVDTHHLLFQTHFRLDQRAIFRLPPSSL